MFLDQLVHFWTMQDQFGPIGNRLNQLRPIWTKWDQHGPIGNNIDKVQLIEHIHVIFGPIRTYMDVFGPIQKNLG